MAGVLKKQGSKIKKSPGDRIVDVIIYVGLALVALSTVLPFLYVVAGSFATDKELTEKAFFIIPEVWSLNAYKYIVVPNAVNITEEFCNIDSIGNDNVYGVFTYICVPSVQEAFQRT